MDSLGQAYRVAVEMQQSFGEEAANVALEKAESYRRKGEEEEASYWDPITAFTVHMARYPAVH